jgi:hypothetical protein
MKPTAADESSSQEELGRPDRGLKRGGHLQKPTDEQAP